MSHPTPNGRKVLRVILGPLHITQEIAKQVMRLFQMRQTIFLFCEVPGGTVVTNVSDGTNLFPLAKELGLVMRKIIQKMGRLYEKESRM
jgi:hypothetical protein